MTMGNSACCTLLQNKEKAVMWTWQLCMLIPVKSPTVPSCLASNQMQKHKIKYKNCLFVFCEILHRKRQEEKSNRRVREEKYRESLCSSLWWHCKRQIAGSERVWSSDVHTFTTRQEFPAVASRRRPSQVHLGWNFASKVWSMKRETVNFFHVDLMQDTFRDNAALRWTKFTHRSVSVFFPLQIISKRNWYDSTGGSVIAVVHVQMY